MPGALDGFRIYLAGPIENGDLMPGNWREPMVSWLRKNGAKVIDPSESETLEFASNVKQLRLDGKFDELHETMKGVCGRDAKSVTWANIVIARFNPDEHTTGTISEIEWGLEQNKLVLCICEQGLVHIPLWIFGRLQRRFLFESWKDLQLFLCMFSVRPGIEKCEDSL